MTNLGIKNWECSKPRSGGYAFLTVEDEAKGRAVILNLNQKIRYPSFRYPMKFEISKKAGKAATQRAENELNDEISKSRSLQFRRETLTSNPIVNPRMFPLASVKIGYFDYPENQLRFHPTAFINMQSDLIFGKNSAALLVYPAGSDSDWKYRVDIDYWMVRLITISPGDTPAIILSLGHAPKIFKRAPTLIGMRRNRVRRHRVPTFDGLPQDSDVRYCFVYRAALRTKADVARAKNLIRSTADFPQSVLCEVLTSPAPYQMASAMASLRDKITNAMLETKVNFIVAFQTLKLAMNGKLLPPTVEGLLPQIASCVRRWGAEKTAIGLRELYKSAPNRGPETSFEELTIETLAVSLARLVESARVENGPYFGARKNRQLQVVHRVRVTPVGLYLEGPEAEVSNRVLRKYSQKSDCFLRTQFSEEDGMKLEGSLITNLDQVFQRFRELLQDGFRFFGRNYSFLGFSSSSLRSQTCWMMCSFYNDNYTVMNPERVIQGIGNFSGFRSPARCAARIGQAFTETAGFVSHPSAIATLPDVERNGRCFSDGCGTISRALCEEICLQHRRLAIPAVVFQIRFMGEYGLLLHARRQGCRTAGSHKYLRNVQLCWSHSLSNTPCRGFERI
jgi:hypothetical protein